MSYARVKVEQISCRSKKGDSKNKLGMGSCVSCGTLYDIRKEFKFFAFAHQLFITTLLKKFFFGLNFLRHNQLLQKSLLSCWRKAEGRGEGRHRSWPIFQMTFSYVLCFVSGYLILKFSFRAAFLHRLQRCPDECFIAFLGQM